MHQHEIEDELISLRNQFAQFREEHTPLLGVGICGDLLPSISDINALRNTVAQLQKEVAEIRINQTPVSGDEIVAEFPVKKNALKEIPGGK